MNFKLDNQKSVPNWLSSIETKGNMPLDNHELPLNDILKDSLYFPQCGFDGRPVQYLGGFIHSFIYVDNDIYRNELSAKLLNKPFLGYHLTGRKVINHDILAPHGLIQILQNVNKLKYETDIIKLNKLHKSRMIHDANFDWKPFSEWLIFDRIQGSRYEESHGPKRFSILYVCADSIATYQALYTNRNIAPLALAIIDQNRYHTWTSITDQKGIFAQLVTNQTSIPRYMISGGKQANRSKAFWHRKYPTLVEYFQHENGNGLWERNQTVL